MISCDGCGKEFDERDFQIVLPRMPGHFHSLDCAERAYRRHASRERLVQAYGLAEAERILAAAAGEPVGRDES